MAVLVKRSLRAYREPIDLNRAVCWSMAALSLTYWTLLRPYGGILHDALLYGLQSMAILLPGSLGGDVFFGPISQDTFTAFPHIWAGLITVLGLEDSARILTIVGHLLWIAAFVYLARQFFSWAESWTSLAILAALPGYYAAQTVFQIAEPFLTPRLYSEAFSLFAIALTLRNRLKAAFLVVIVAMALHPIMALGPAILCTYLALGLQNRKWVSAAICTGLLAACATAIFFPIYPLSQIDQDWWQLSLSRSPFLAMQGWDIASAREPLITIAAIWIFSRSIVLPSPRQFLTTTLLVAAWGFAVTLIGTDLARVALITQGQAWRWTWLTSAFLPIAAVLGTKAMWRSGDSHRSALLLLVSAWLLDGPWSIGLALFALASWHIRTLLSPALERLNLLVAISLWVVSVVAWLTTISQEWLLLQDDGWGRPLLRWIRFICSEGQVLLLTTAACSWALLYFPRSRRVITVTCVMIAAVSLFASGPELARADYKPLDPSVAAEWRRAIPESAEVFWPSRPSMTWFVLQRRHYVSATQSAGSIFSRDTAFELHARSQLTSPILTPRLVFSRSLFFWTPDLALIRAVCARADFGFFVSDRPFRAAEAAAEPLTLPDKLKGAEPFYLYDCRELLGSSSLAPDAR